MALLCNDTIRLRALEPTDVDTLYALENDTAHWGSASTTAPFSRQQLWQHIQNSTANPWADGELRLVVELAHSHEAVGLVELINVNAQHRRAEVGILIATPHMGRGYGGQALQLLTQYAQQHLAMNQLYAIIAQDNTASLHLFASQGWQQAGVLQAWLQQGSARQNAVVMQRVF